MYYRLYENKPAGGIAPMSFRTTPGGVAATGARLTFNVCRSVSDAFVAEMVVSKPKAMFVTSGGSASLQRKAKKVDRWCDGMNERDRYYELREQRILDACIWGHGIVKTWADLQEGVIRRERVLPFQLVTDSTESLFGNPRSVYEYRWVDRSVLWEAFPEHREIIETAERAPIDFSTTGYDSTADLVLTMEAYHLKSGKNAKDGRHVICIAGCDLFDEEWESPRFPYSVWRRQKAPLGDRPTSLIGEVMPIQRELSKLLGNLQRATHLLGHAHIVAEAGSIDSAKVDNEDGSILYYKPGSNPPNVVAGPIASPEIYQQIDRLYGKAFEIPGISQLQAQGIKPAGLDSGEAQRVYNDTTSRRFSVAQHIDERVVLEDTELQMAAGRMLVDAGIPLIVSARNRRRMDRLDLKEIMLAEDEYMVDIYPISAYSRDPAERLAQIQEDVKDGWFDLATGHRLADMPDLDEADSLMNSSYNLCMQMIDNITEEGRYVGPNPMMDLADALKRFQQATLKAMVDELEPERIQMLENWIQAAQDILTPPKDEPPPEMNAPQAPEGPMTPPAAEPGPPPDANGAVPQQPMGPPPGVPMQ